MVWFRWALGCLQNRSCWGKEVLEHEQLSVRTRVSWPVKQAQTQGLSLVVTGGHLYDTAGAPSNWLGVGRKLYSCWQDFLCKKEGPGHLWVHYFHIFLICGDAFIGVWREGNVEDECPTYLLPFLPFPLSSSVPDSPIHNSDDKLLCCQELSCLSMAEAMELPHQCKHGLAIISVEKRQSSRRRSSKQELWQKPPILSWSVGLQG